MQLETEFSADGVVVVHGDAIDVLERVVDDGSVNLVFVEEQTPSGGAY